MLEAIFISGYTIEIKFSKHILVGTLISGLTNHKHMLSIEVMLIAYRKFIRSGSRMLIGQVCLSKVMLIERFYCSIKPSTVVRYCYILLE